MGLCFGEPKHTHTHIFGFPAHHNFTRSARDGGSREAVQCKLEHSRTHRCGGSKWPSCSTMQTEVLQCKLDRGRDTRAWSEAACGATENTGIRNWHTKRNTPLPSCHHMTVCMSCPWDGRRQVVKNCSATLFLQGLLKLRPIHKARIGTSSWGSPRADSCEGRMPPPPWREEARAVLDPWRIITIIILIIILILLLLLIMIIMIVILLTHSNSLNDGCAACLCGLFFHIMFQRSSPMDPHFYTYQTLKQTQLACVDFLNPRSSLRLGPCRRSAWWWAEAAGSPVSLSPSPAPPLPSEPTHAPTAVEHCSEPHASTDIFVLRTVELH